MVKKRGGEGFFELKLIFIVFLLLFSVGPVLAVKPTFNETLITFYGVESSNSTIAFTNNFTKNVLNPNNETLAFSIFDNRVNSSLYPQQPNLSFYSWISMDSASGVFNINSTRDNETGRFNVSLSVFGNLEGDIGAFYFIVNATNDRPNFTSIQPSYNLTQDREFTQYFNASDEENHFPLLFNVTFVSCIHSGWSTRTNCSLINSTNFLNSSALLSYTPTHNDVGVYYANVSVMDSGAIYNCSAYPYCEPNYSRNLTYYYPTLVEFNVLSNMSINVSDCENKVFNYSSSNTCNVSIITRGASDSLQLSSFGFLRNYNANVANNSWFYSTQSTSSTGFTKVVTINVTPSITEIGNWTINFTVNDLTYSEILTEPIHIVVNRSANDAPDLFTIPNINTSVTFSTRINLSSYDDDFLIADKNYSYGGFNESSNFTVRVLNASNLNQELSTINGFNLQIVNMPVTSTNRTYAKIEFTPNLTSYGNYTINVTVNDFDGSKDSIIFNLTIIDNDPPQWNPGSETNFSLFEGDSLYLNISKNITDPDGDSVTFDFTNDTLFPSFSLSSIGLLTIDARDADVGYHVVTINSRDSLGLVNSTNFYFTIQNLNDTPYIKRPIIQSDVLGAVVSGGSFIDADEDNSTTINIWTQDDDFKIPSGQRSQFYTESLNFSVLIVGPNSSLFTFTRNAGFAPNPLYSGNDSKYTAVFTPKKNDVGKYNITINVTDNSGLSNLFSFNMTIHELDHPPVIVNLSNKTTAVNRTLYYRLDASDVESGYSNITGGNINFTFSYVFLNGTDFINNNESIFNTTTGALNITFNSTQGGVYRLNVTAKTGNLNDSKDFWIFVYDVPALNYPSLSEQYYLSENSSSSFVFTVNHSMNNNLSYFVYVYNWKDEETIIKNLTSYFGNNTNISFTFTPDFKNETNGIKNLTLVSYPTDTNLENRELVNLTSSWNLTINHTNDRLSFSSSNFIGGSEQKISGGSPYSLTLSDYFSDYDAIDSLYNQSVSFNYTSYTSGCGISAAIGNWTNRALPTVNFSATSNSVCNFSITGTEFNSSNSSQIIGTASSNNFTVELSVTSIVINTPTSGSSSRVSVPYALKIITPEPIDAYPMQTITVPISVENTGKKAFSAIALKTTGFRDGAPTDSMEVSLDKTSIASLNVGQKEDLKMTIHLKTNLSGSYEILINATSTTPKYSDWAKVYVNLRKINDTEVKKYILFSEGFITQNVRCNELKEYIKEAYSYFNRGDYGNARLTAEKAVNACKGMTSEVRESPVLDIPTKNLLIYLMAAVLIAFVLGLGYYLIERERVRRGTAIKLYHN